MSKEQTMAWSDWLWLVSFLGEGRVCKFFAYQALFFFDLRLTFEHDTALSGNSRQSPLI